jgi:hypothetical protein
MVLASELDSPVAYRCTPLFLTVVQNKRRGFCEPHQVWSINWPEHYDSYWSNRAGCSPVYANVEMPRYRGKNVPIVTNGTNDVKKQTCWICQEFRKYQGFCSLNFNNFGVHSNFSAKLTRLVPIGTLVFIQFPGDRRIKKCFRSHRPPLIHLTAETITGNRIFRHLMLLSTQFNRFVVFQGGEL